MIRFRSRILCGIVPRNQLRPIKILDLHFAMSKKKKLLKSGSHFVLKTESKNM